MRYLIVLSLAVCLFASCNRDATGATTNATDLSTAPATPPTPPTMSGITEEKRPVEARPDIVNDTEMERSNRDEISMTEEQLRAGKRLGPGKNAGMPNAVRPAARTTAPEKAAPTPVTSGNQKPVLDYDRPIFEVNKSPCYAKEGCRQYKLSLTNDRRLVLEAGKNMERKGTYSRMLNAREYQELKTGMEALEPATMPATYPENTKMIPADVQATVLRFPDVYGKKKKVEIYGETPEKMTAYLTELDAWVDKDGWVKIK